MPNQTSKKFIPLSKMITFVTLDILQPKENRFTPKDFEKLLRSDDFENEIDQWLKQFHPANDQSLEGDIYSQNQKRNRSIVEEVSNSIDAHPDAIHCIIRNGYYEVREVNGQGMSPEIVCTKYLPPKATTKNNSEKQIGRFGIGSFTKLAHLNDPNASVIVETRAPGQIGCRLEYRLVEGTLQIAVEADDSIQSCGTVTKVNSTEITAKDYEAILKENIGDDLKIPLSINGQIFVPEDNHHQAAICINNIRIQRINQSNDSFTTKVIWDLLHGTTISESRDKIILDHDATRETIRQKIAELRNMEYPAWVLYANTIAPLVAEIQTTNNSLQSKDNVFDYLLHIVNEKLASNLSVPDTPFYKPLVTGNIIPLHPSLLPVDWIKRVAYLASEFNHDKTKIYVADLINYNEETPFIFDKKENWVVVDKKYYQKLKKEHNLELLALIFKYPPNEINAELCVRSIEQSDKQCNEIVYNKDLINHPFHNLYQQHGLLWLYGEEATQLILNAHTDAEAILAKAKSLISIYPMPKYITHSKSTFFNNITGPLLAFRYKEKRYYYDTQVNSKHMIYDEHFQILRDSKWKIVKSKLLQLFNDYEEHEEAYSLDLDLTINDNELFALENQLGTYDLINGKGEIVDASMSCNYMVVKPIDGNYYDIMKSDGFRIKHYLYHKVNGLITKLSNKNASWEVIPDSSLLARKSCGEIINLIDINTNKFVLKDYGKILSQHGFLLGQKKREHDFFFAGDKSVTPLILTTLSGKVIAEINSHLRDEVMYFDCQTVDENHYNVSIIDKSGEVNFIQINCSANTISCHLYDSQQTIGYPVSAIINTNDNNSTLTFLNEKENGLVDNAHFKFITPYINKSKNSYYSSDEYNKVSLQRLYNPQPILILYNNQVAILDPESLSIIPLPINFDPKLTSIYKYDNHYYFEYPDKDALLADSESSWGIGGNKKTKTSIFDVTGKHIITGKDVHIYKTSEGYGFYGEGEVFLPNGCKIDCPPVRYASILTTATEQLISVSLKEEDTYYKIYDLKGNEVHADKKLSFIDSQKEDGFYSFNSRDPETSRLYTPYGQIERGVLQRCNSTYSGKANDLITQGWGKTNGLLTRAGYSFFNETVPEYNELLRNHMVLLNKPENMQFRPILMPLSKEQLSKKSTFDNLRFLNQLNLETYQYSQCLRFIDWPQEYFKKIAPYIDCFLYTPTLNLEWGREYETIINFCETLSSADRNLVLKTFDLVLKITHEQLVEPIAQKLIDIVECYGVNTLAEFYTRLSNDQYELEFTKDFMIRKTLIDEMPSVSGQLCYYLMYPENQLLSALQSPCFEPLIKQSQVSLLNFMTAFQFNDRILELLKDPAEFIKEVNKWGNYADKSYPLRLLQHAIYHQSDPNKHLYERELLQNALDAYAAHSLKGDDANIPVHLYRENNHCVFRMENKGMGMSLQDIFYYFGLVGTSSKRSDKHQRFIGGHGVGAFTVYHQAELIRLKSGKGNGEIYCFEFRPIYQDNKIVDIDITWDIMPGHFEGVTIERIDRSTKPTLEASRHHRTFKMHARTVNAAVATITLNDKPINHDLKIIAAIDIPEIGKLTLCQSVEDMITVGGLSVRPINDLDQFIPEEIRNIVRLKGLIIDLPKKIPLNRERTEVIDADHVYEFLKPFLIRAYIDGYVQLFMQEHIALTELPYDFFEYFELYIKNMEMLNPDLKQDAENIKNNKPLQHYDKYQSIANLHELMTYLPLFKAKKENQFLTSMENKQDAYSLNDLAQYYIIHLKFPELETMPFCLQEFAHRYENSLVAKKYQSNFALTLDNFPAIDWLPAYLVEAPVWQALLEMSVYMAECMGFKNMKFGFSTARSGDLLHTNTDTGTIYWNVYALNDSQSITNCIMRDFEQHRGINLNYYNKFLDAIAHELVHAHLEQKCSSTHNRTFALKQRQILINLSQHSDRKTIIAHLTNIFDKNVTQNLKGFIFDTREFLKKQFLDKNKNLTFFSLFPALAKNNGSAGAKEKNAIDFDNMEIDTEKSMNSNVL
ncbi:MAG: ATP-binding protein [Gammaproteobacteria bacterium]|nr:ATP-binding protein [Gammaproteobacteria bacterium]